MCRFQIVRLTGCFPYFSSRHCAPKPPIHVRISLNALQNTPVPCPCPCPFLHASSMSTRLHLSQRLVFPLIALNSHIGASSHARRGRVGFSAFGPAQAA